MNRKRIEKLSIEQVACLLDVSTATINNWYRWKKINPEHPLAQMLPDYSQPDGIRQKRLWNRMDIVKMMEFKKKLQRGRTGVMGSITQRYLKTSRHYAEYQKQLAEKNKDK